MEFCALLTALILINLNCISCMETKETSNETSELQKQNPNLTAESENNENEPDTYWHSYSYSPVDLWLLATFEEKLFKVVKQYVAKLDHEPEHFFQRYIADYEDSSAVAYKDWNSSSTKKRNFIIHTNPLLSYRMIWRFVTDLTSIKDVLLSSEDSEIVNAFEKHKPRFWPTQDDLNNSMNSLLNIHFVYDLNVKELANGIIANVVTNTSLSGIHCFEISKHALSIWKLTLALQWLEVAELKRLDASGHPILDYLEADQVASLLEYIIEDHDENWIEEGPHEHNLYTYLNKIDSNFTLTTRKAFLQKNFIGKGRGEFVLSLNDVSAFSTLCKGGNLQSEKEKAELYCWYESKINPAWYINPQKMELFSKDPYIFQVYDFIGDEFIKYLKKEAIPIMERAKVSHQKDSLDELYPVETTKYNISEARTSMYSWLQEEKYKRVSMLSKKIGYLTGLIASDSTEGYFHALQISMYATGGSFDLHVDPMGSTPEYEEHPMESIGDRLATFMLYLNDVELGGNTAFTSAGVAVPPVKGSAVFWYDCKRNGEVDYKGWHGGCPVLLGEKWVGNKWIHNNLNIFQYKCTLNKDE